MTDQPTIPHRIISHIEIKTIQKIWNRMNRFFDSVMLQHIHPSEFQHQNYIIQNQTYICEYILKFKSMDNQEKLDKIEFMLLQGWLESTTLDDLITFSTNTNQVEITTTLITWKKKYLHRKMCWVCWMTEPTKSVTKFLWNYGIDWIHSIEQNFEQE